MRILAVTNMYPSASNVALGTFVEQQVQGLRAAGAEVKVLYVDRQQNGTRVYLTVRRRIREALNTFNADVVHVMYGGVMAALTTRAVKDRPTVVTFHGTDLLGEHLSSVYRRIVARCGVFCSHLAARRAAGIVVVAPVLFDALPLTVDVSRVRVIPCGIDMTRFVPMDRALCRRQLGWDDGSFHILFNCNGDDPVKRLDLARAAVAELKGRGITAELHELRGHPNHEVAIHLNAADVLLLTSRHEGSPTIVKEALACNVPVVSVDVGDVREQIADIEGCHLAFPTPPDLVSRLLAVHAGPRRVEGRPKIQALSIHHVAQRLTEFYDSVTARWAGCDYGDGREWEGDKSQSGAV